VSYLAHVVILITIYGILALSLYPLACLAGMMSVAQAAFFGLGAYTTAIMSLRYHTPWFAEMLAAMALALLVSFMISVPSVRLQDDYFLIATFAFQMVLFGVFNNWTSVTRGPQGIPGIPSLLLFGDRTAAVSGTLGLSLAIAGVSYWIVTRIANSPIGRVLRAIREDELFAQALGKDTHWTKIVIFAVGAAMASVAGCLYARYMTYIDPTAFTVNESIFVLLMVILGGPEKAWGPLVGSSVLLVIPEVLRVLGFSGAVGASIRQIAYGSILVLIMLIRPRGVGTKTTWLR
jgi:branched-chain amino acid transport system permease protein